MRDNHKGMPEIVDAFIDENGLHTGVIAIEIDGEIRKFRFGVPLAGYHALKRILQLRPFEIMPGLKHRYFFTGNYGRRELPKCEVTIRVEQGKGGMQMRVEMLMPLLQNLIWFQGLKDFSEAAHLPEEK
jgi:hypothetical protein